MATQSKLVINGRGIQATVGESLIDAALGAWLIIPHDCRSGQCESCRVNVVSGEVDDQGTAVGRTVLACQARVSADAEIEFDEIPLPEKRTGILTEFNVLSSDTVEIVIQTDGSFIYRPGQYARLKFLGYPAREYSPTCRLDGSSSANELAFHIRLLPDGYVSGQLGKLIKPGHRCHVQGPFGTAFLRDDPGPLILVAGGTGWAPLWSMARAARETQRHRHMVVIAGSRDGTDIYMRPALNWLIDDGVQDVFATAEIKARGPILPGRPTHYLPLLNMEDTVYVAGPPGLVETVKRKAGLASSRCYADPFLPSARSASVTDRLQRLLNYPARRPKLARI